MDNTARMLHSQCEDVMLQTILSPIYALQVCGLVRERKYRQAQLFLEMHLKDEWPLSKFSEFLWCQYVQLRSTLPFSQEFVHLKKEAKITLPNAIAIEHRTIATRIEELGIHCNHISLSGDTVLLMQVCKEEEAKTSIQTWTEASLKPGSMPQSLDLSNLIIGNASGSDVPVEPAGLKSALYFPRSVLVGGWAISSLNLVNCQITELPLSFGKYLANLQVRDDSLV
jgi:hypothetical protein